MMRQLLPVVMFPPTNTLFIVSQANIRPSSQHSAETTFKSCFKRTDQASKIFISMAKNNLFPAPA